MRPPLLVFVLFVVLHVHASSSIVAPEQTPEETTQSAYRKGVANPDKSARMSAVDTFAKTKPALPASWQLFAGTMNSDPDPDVRFTAFSALATMPAHDARLARLLVGAFNDLKLNDMKARIAYAKAMAPSEFKTDTASALVEELSKMRYTPDPRGYRGSKPSDKQKEDAKEKRDELKEMLDAFNAIAGSNVTEIDKDTPVKVKKWWDVNQMKFAKADAELTEKYAKADLEAANAAKAASKK